MTVEPGAPGDFTIDCTGDVVAGDTILFAEAVFAGSYRRPRFVGERRVAARVLRDGYGGAKQQHSFTLEILWSDGVEPLAAGARTVRKGRNLYRRGTRRLPWPDESARRAAADEKHVRGDAARAARELRRAEEEWR